MAELAQPPQPLRPPARAQRWRHHQDDREPDRTGDGWNLALMSHIQRRQRETTLLNVIKDLTGLLWSRDRRRPELLPSFAQDAFGSLSKMAFADRLLGPSDPALQRPLHPPSPPPPRTEEPFRETLREMGDSTAEDDTASQPQTAGIRILALHPTRSGDLCGLYDVVDLETRIRELRDQVSDSDAIASKLDYDEYGDDFIDIGRCWFDADKWQCVHGEGCNGFWGDENADYYEYFGCSFARHCGLEQQMGRLEDISKLEAATLWSATLENPILAAGNSLFPSGLVKSPKAFYEDLRRARETGHVRGLAHMKFTGFRVVWPEEEPGFIFAMRCCEVVVLACLGILGARIAYGDWGIAYTAGAFFVALVGIVMIWPGHPEAPVATKSKTA
ncbi:hypothetical protein CGCSCA1_v006985 [Colletotrichum siamense]|nr:hypothetical protein CGCSCA1_v006985 [Colletotrichum siamense]